MANRLRDEALAQEIRTALAEHISLHDIRIDLHVDGGVAHVAGEVANAAVRRQLREVMGRVRQVHAVWETLQLAGQPRPVIVDIGCGDHKQIPSSLGVDYFRSRAADMRANIECGLPFRDQSVDQVYAVQVLEHVRDLIGLMNEIHRVLKPDGVLHVMVPYWKSVNAVADPTHVRFFNPQTFKFFCRPYPQSRCFRPLMIATNEIDVFADLQPVVEGETVSELELARFFD